MIVIFPITEEKIEEIVKNLANEIYNYFKEKNINKLYFIIILTSSFVFAADLMRNLNRLGMLLRTDTIRAKSYKGKESGELNIRVDDFEKIDLNEQNILVVDDILDTGETLFHVKNHITDLFKPSNLEFCCLLNKTHTRRTKDVFVRFIGIEVPDEFIIGYGLDYNGQYRELPYITTIDKLNQND